VGWQVVGAKQSGVVLPGDGRALVAFAAEDGRPGFIAATNNGPAVTLKPAPAPGQRNLTIRLEGAKGNPSATGARVRVTCGSAPPMFSEVTAGGGYLSQQSSALYFGLGKESADATIEVRWPGGKVSTYSTGREERKITLKAP
jgi:enediyne biosynthesis protein E4